MPVTAEKDSKNPAEKSCNGLIASTTNAAAERVVSGSGFRPYAWASRTSIVMTAARTDEGEKPVIMQYSARKAVITYRRPRLPTVSPFSSQPSASASSPTCRPETAIRWATPARRKAACSSSASASRSPSSIAMARSPSSPISCEKRSLQKARTRAEKLAHGAVSAVFRISRSLTLVTPYPIPFCNSHIRVSKSHSFSFSLGRYTVPLNRRDAPSNSSSAE
jgi:hypothetical protein